MANQYYYLDSANQQHGPVAAETLKNNGVHEKSLVWCVGMTSWTPANQVPELQVYFPPIPTPPSQPSPNNYKPQQQQTTQPQQTTTLPPNSHLALAIISTFLCWPFGLVAILKSTKVESLWHQGFRQEAIDAANSAKKWSIISICAWLLLIVFYILYFVFLIALSGL